MTTDADVVALLDTQRLRRFLDPVAPVPEELTVRVLSGGRSNLTYLVSSGPHEYVVRRRPIGAVAAGAHDMAREYRVQAALAGSGLPIATVYGFSDDESVVGAPFYVMGRVHGSVFHRPADVAHLGVEAAAGISEATVEVLARLHRVDPDAVGLGNLGRPDGFVRRRIGRWLETWRASEHGEYPLVEDLGARLAGLVPDACDSTLVHGDYRLGNMVVSDDTPARIAAVLDWEMSTLGDPMTDLAHLLVYWEPTCGRVTHESQRIAAAPGFLDAATLADRYRALSGRDGAALEFYLAFEHWRAAIIKEGIAARLRHGGHPDPDDDDVGSTVGVHLEEARDILGDR